MKEPFAIIVEDNEDQAITFTHALQAAGYATETITDSEYACERLSEATPSLVLLDLHMPKISGDVLLQQIRADQRLAHTRVFLTTADALLAESLRTDADLVLLKPVSFEQLMDLSKRFMYH